MSIFEENPTKIKGIIIMRESVFNSKLLEDGHLYCPKKFAVKDAKFKVIVSIPQDNASDSEIEMASTIDTPDDFLTEEEIKYYLQLKD